MIALDGASGKQLWQFNSRIVGRQPSRGLTYWSDGKESRLFAYIMNFLYALNPVTGQPIGAFGENGRLDMRKDLDSDYTQNSVALTTPGVLCGDLLVLGFRAPETHPAPRGDIRAYNVRTGKLAWTFHTIPHPGEEGYTTWPQGAWKSAGAANNWAGMSVDQTRGIVYVPTGSAVSDFYGANRVGDDLFADTLVALVGRTGKMLWHFQGVHHDIWDRDFPSPPALVTIRHEGKMVDAVAQTTKQGSSLSSTVSPASLSSRSRSARFPPPPFLERWPPAPSNTAAFRSPASDRRDAHHTDRGSACLVRRTVQSPPQRWSFRPSVAR